MSEQSMSKAIWQRPSCKRAYLDEANLGGALAEAATAHVQVVLADQTTGRVAHAAVAGVLAVVAWVGVLKVGHLDGCNKRNEAHASFVSLAAHVCDLSSVLRQRDLRSALPLSRSRSPPPLFFPCLSPVAPVEQIDITYESRPRVNVCTAGLETLYSLDLCISFMLVIAAAVIWICPPHALESGGGNWNKSTRS